MGYKLIPPNNFHIECDLCFLVVHKFPVAMSSKLNGKKIKGKKIKRGKLSYKPTISLSNLSGVNNQKLKVLFFFSSFSFSFAEYHFIHTYIYIKLYMKKLEHLFIVHPIIKLQASQFHPPLTHILLNTKLDFFLGFCMFFLLEKIKERNFKIIKLYIEQESCILVSS